MADKPTPHTWVELQRIRVAEGLTLADLARKASVSLPYLSQLESGARTSPRPPIRKKLADALGVRVADLDPAA